MSEGVNVGQATVLFENELSLKVNLEGEEVLIPKSQIHDNSEVYKAGTEGSLIVTEWLAEKRGWSE